MDEQLVDEEQTAGQHTNADELEGKHLPTGSEEAAGIVHVAAVKAKDDAVDGLAVERLLGHEPGSGNAQDVLQHVLKPRRLDAFAEVAREEDRHVRQDAVPATATGC